MSAESGPGVETVYAGPLFRVEIQRWADGRRRDVVRHPGACAALVFDEDRRVVLVRQAREAVGKRLLEIPAGIYDVAGESPEQAIRREIREETGHRPGRILGLGRILTSPGFADEAIDLFVARASSTEASPEEGIELVRMPFAAVVEAVLSGRIQDAKTVAAVLLVQARGLAPGPATA